MPAALQNHGKAAACRENFCRVRAETIDLLVSGRLGPRTDPKTGAVCRQNFCRRAKNSASFDCFRRYATAYRWATVFPAAPRAIVLHALRTFMPTHVLELFKRMCGHKCSHFTDKTAPVLGSRNGPQNGGHSFSLNLICLCPDDLAPVLGSVSGPQNGGRLSAKFLPPGEK